MRQVLAPLHALDVFQQLRFGQRKVGIAKPLVIERFRLIALARIDPIGRATGKGLARKAIHHGIDGQRLVRLNLELELHGHGQMAFSSVPGES